MQRLIQFPIKGCFYYDALMACELKLVHKHSQLVLQPESDNAYDKNAIQIWLPFSISTTFATPLNSTEIANIPKNPNNNKSDDNNSKLLYQGLLLGYVPRQLAKQLCVLLAENPDYNLAVSHQASKGHLIEVDCVLQINTPFMNYLELQLKSKWLALQEQLKRLQRRFFYKENISP